jgi:hypothetical protein
MKKIVTLLIPKISKENKYLSIMESPKTETEISGGVGDLVAPGKEKSAVGSNTNSTDISTDKDSLLVGRFACPFKGCVMRYTAKSKLTTHIRTHVRGRFFTNRPGRNPLRVKSVARNSMKKVFLKHT